MADNPIYLIGYMACGKTTLGGALQKAFPELLEFVDLDHAIEQDTGMSIPEIFKTRGEAEFRRLESEMLAQLASRQSDRRIVIGCGGGTPCHGTNLDIMLSEGTVIWLRASRERTLNRLNAAEGQRPLVAGMDPESLGDFVDRNLAQRTPFYSRAHHTFDTTLLENEAEIADTVARFASLYLNKC